MPCSELFWANFLEVFPKTLGVALGALPAILGFWGGMAALFHLQGRREDARYGLGSRVSELERRVISFESHRQRGA